MEQFFKGISGHQRLLYLACTSLCMAIWHDGVLNTEQWTCYNCRVVTTVFTVITSTNQPGWFNGMRGEKLSSIIVWNSAVSVQILFIGSGLVRGGAAAQQITPLSLRSLVAIYIVRRRLRGVCYVRTIPLLAGKGENIYGSNNIIIFK